MADITDKDNPTSTPSQSGNPSDQTVSPNDIETTDPNQHNENMEIHKHPHHVTHKKKWPEYLLEFFMLFLAVFLGFLVENSRERLVNKEKEHHYMQNMVADLKADTADLNFAIYYQQLWSDHLDSALQISIERLSDINSQDTFFYHVFPYYCWMQPFMQNDNNITQLRAGGFNLIESENTIDSINLVYNFYKGVKFGVDFNITCYWDVVHKAQQLMNLPPPPATIEEVVPKRILQNTQIFIQYDKPAIQQLFSMMTNAKGTLINTIVSEKQYKEKAERLLSYLQKEYHLD
jgi:hypothetical protein